MEKFQEAGRSKRESFEDQFLHPEVYDLEGSGSQVKIYDLKPEQPKSQVPTYFAMGWSETPTALRENLIGLAEEGRHVIASDTPHGLETNEEGLDYNMAELRKMTGLMQTLETKEIEKVDVVAHSEGAVFTAIAASLHPEKFRNIVFVNPAGMIGKDNPLSLVARFGADMIHHVLNTGMSKEKKAAYAKIEGTAKSKEPSPLNAILTVSGSPIRSAKEIGAISATDVVSMLESLHDNGIGITVIYGAEDKTFPATRMSKTIRSKEDREAGRPLKIDGALAVAGTHNQMFKNPKAFARLLDQSLADLEKKKKKNASGGQRRKDSMESISGRGIYFRTNQFRLEHPTLIFVHGLSGSSSAWLPYEKIFQNKYNTLVFDLRGHGKSVKRPNYNDYEIKDFVRDIEGLIQYLNISRFILVSHSLDTLIALDFLSRNQSKVSSAIFLAPIFGIKRVPMAAVIHPFISAICVLLKFLPARTRPGYQVHYEQYRNTGDWDLHRMAADIPNTGFHVYFYSLGQMYKFDCQDCLSNIKVPVLLMHGGKDTIIPAENSLKAKELIPAVKIALLEKANHILVLNNIEEVSAAIMKFLESQSID
ncbi:MAG: alpha/beta hydrolase [Candidatus Sungbacteria bacterium]|uniref:Alpha/beta hydrolase n=1 Tax=Candidatus Sungiibacteriota bacterium TaxID=2750080 RepID=A0A9D6QYY0_9BACT|nr:alpha/beta hydrolase [Candidatus Sungbacteria bacterium]